MPCVKNWHAPKQVIELVDEACSGPRNLSYSGKTESSFLSLQKTEKIHSLSFKGRTDSYAYFPSPRCRFPASPNDYPVKS